MSGLGFSFRTDLDYMTRAESAAFKDLRKDGGFSFFRTARCKHCGNDVPQGKLFCRLECSMESLDVESVAKQLVGKQVNLETKDGTSRHGEVTGIVWGTLSYNDKEVCWPEGVILNGDNHDEISWQSLKWIKETT